MTALNWSLRLPEGATLVSGGYNRPISIRYADGTLVHYTPKALARQERFSRLPQIEWMRRELASRRG